jgi:ABC-type sugar transport system ATPase subunit
LGFRPEDVTVEKKKPSSPAIEANIYVLETLGSQILVSLLVDNFVLKSVENPNREYELSQLVGQKVWLKIDMKKIHLFDKKTGNLII